MQGRAQSVPEQGKHQQGATIALYGNASERARALGELHDLWKRLGREVTAANSAARLAWPLHGHRTRTRQTAAALHTAYKALSASDRALVDEARSIQARRQAVNRALTETEAGEFTVWVTSAALRLLEDGDCPTYRTLVGRWQQACGDVDQAHAEKPSQRWVADRARVAELDRRAQALLDRARRQTGGS